MDFQLSMFSPAIINVDTVYFTHTLSLKARIILPWENQISQIYTNTLSNETQK